MLTFFINQQKTGNNNWGLDSLENGFHDLQIRVWYNAVLVKDRKLVVIANKDSYWTAIVYDFQVERAGETEKMPLSAAPMAIPTPAISAAKEVVLTPSILATVMMSSTFIPYLKKRQ